jgi:hypothetical protein
MEKSQEQIRALVLQGLINGKLEISRNWKQSRLHSPNNLTIYPQKVHYNKQKRQYFISYTTYKNAQQRVQAPLTDINYALHRCIEEANELYKQDEAASSDINKIIDAFAFKGFNPRATLDEYEQRSHTAMDKLTEIVNCPTVRELLQNTHNDPNVDLEKLAFAEPVMLLEALTNLVPLIAQELELEYPQILAKYQELSQERGNMLLQTKQERQIDNILQKQWMVFNSNLLTFLEGNKYFLTQLFPEISQCYNKMAAKAASQTSENNYAKCLAKVGLLNKNSNRQHSATTTIVNENEMSRPGK